MDTRVPHISVCICTFKRRHLLTRLLQELSDQHTDGLFTYSLVVVDNDVLGSAEEVILKFREQCGIPATYCVEPRQNISLARNRAVSCATGHFIALIDDDEFPTHTWLACLFRTCQKYEADGVLGPVKRHFDEPPPEWLLKTAFYTHMVHPTGTPLEGDKGLTGNVLLNRNIFRVTAPLNPR